MKKTVAILLMLSLLFCFPVPAQATEFQAEALILYEPRTGTVLAEKNADARMRVASTTKILTALVVLEHCGMDEPVQVTWEQTRVEGSSMYLRPGVTYTVEELLTGLLLASGNDAALALAEHTAGSAAAFAELMNAKCAQLGLKNSHFTNPHGLDDAEHFSSARDLALLTAAAMENEDFCRIFGTRSCVIHGVTYVNHNKLLTSCTGCIGGKTGYTKAAGRTLVSCVERDGLRLICVTLSDPQDWAEHRQLYDEAYAAWQFVSLPGCTWQSVEVVSGLPDSVAVGCTVSGLLLPRDAAVQERVELPRFVFAPVAAGMVLGRVAVLADGKTVYSGPIVARECSVIDAGALRRRVLI